MMIVGDTPMATEVIEMMRHRRDWHWGRASPVWADKCPKPREPCVSAYRACLEAGRCLRATVSAALLALALLAAPAAAQVINNPALGTTGVASGGTGATTLALGGILTGHGASAIDATVLTGLVLGAGTSVPTAYAGASCTNQFPRSLNASGAATCASVANTDLTNSSVTLGAATVALGATAQLKSTSATVGVGAGQLPSCVAGLRGTRYTVTDALVPVALAPVAPGGAAIVNVTCDGTDWIVM